MFILVRKSVFGSNEEYQDLDFDVNELIIGNADNAHLNLEEIANGSITIKPKNEGKAKFSCSNEIEVQTESKLTTTGVLQKGYIYQLGVYDLEIIDVPAGFDFALILSRSNRKSSVDKKKFKIEASKSKTNLRLISYLLFFSIFVIYLLIPYLNFTHSNIKEKTKELPLVTDKSWLSGPMAMAHRIPEIGDDCQVCHVKPFEKVQDEQCLSCHQNLGEHVNAQHPAVEQIDQFLCENCHKEHNEPAQITRTDDTLCVNCHKDINKYETQESLKKNPVQIVTGFDSQNHPPFRLSLIQPNLVNGSYEWKNKRPKFEVNNILVEESNLKFSHKVHLDPEQVQDELTGQVLVCSNCHQLKDDKEHFEPITMDKDCRSCHKLSFDVFNPDIELPHGNLRAAFVMLEAHFIREFTDPELRQKRSRKKIRRIPGKHSNNATCKGSSLNCGRQEALKEAQFQFTQSGCITCHEVTTNKTNELMDKWFVKPIKINQDWYSKARFDHVSHFSVKNKDSEEVCLSCHKVEESDDSKDIAMPQRKKCIECHQKGVQSSVELTCIRCHEFHFEQQKLKGKGK
jgi:predicted CXXCH cytochrome family protein